MNDGKRPDPDLSVDRRSFFRQIVLRGLKKAEDTVQGVVRKLDPVSGAAAAAGAAAGSSPGQSSGAGPFHPAGSAAIRFLRPPGAVPEPLFADLCSRCDECAKACPARCILIDHEPQAPRAGGLPYILARQSPCVVCEDLSCMKVCPTGALKLVDAVSQIDMGLAVVDHARCLRGPLGDKEDCRLCITPCPQGESAIGVDAAGLVVVRPGCIGCGVCERACPTEPASVWVERTG